MPVGDSRNFDTPPTFFHRTGSSPQQNLLSREFSCSSVPSRRRIKGSVTSCQQSIAVVRGTLSPLPDQLPDAESRAGFASPLGHP